MMNFLTDHVRVEARTLFKLAARITTRNLWWSFNCNANENGTFSDKGYSEIEEIVCRPNKGEEMHVCALVLSQDLSYCRIYKGCMNAVVTTFEAFNICCKDFDHGCYNELETRNMQEIQGIEEELRKQPVRQVHPRWPASMHGQKQRKSVSRLAFSPC